MTNLLFQEYLSVNTFSSSNGYNFTNMTDTNLRFYRDSENLPFIMTSAWQSDPTVLRYSANTYQLRNRLLSTAKIKEVLDTSPVPLMISIKNKWYMMGKGFLAHVTNIMEFGESIKLLFVACIDPVSRKKGFDIADVRFFFSRDMYNDDYKTLLPALKDIMLGHPGDVILSSKLNDRIGDRIVFPTGGTLSDRVNYKREVMIECLKDYFA